MNFVFAALLSVALALPASALLVPGGGPKRSDCYSEFNVGGVSALGAKGVVECTDGDPTCDFDGACNDSCSFHVELCPNQSDVAGCTAPSSLSSLAETGPAAKRAGLTIPSLTGTSCSGAFTDVVVAVKVKKNGKKLKGKRSLKTVAAASSGKPKKDPDTLKLSCLPKPEGDACRAAIACSPIGVQGSCLAGEFCDVDGKCKPSVACACGATAPTKLEYITAAGTGSCGAGKNAAGASVVDLGCGDLFFGSGAVATTLPATIPDLGKSIANVTACNGSLLGLAASTSAQTGTTKTCTSKDCFFGAPLPVPNNIVPVVSTCILNVVSKDADGYATCDSGDVTLNLPLSSQLYLTGDLFLSDQGTGHEICYGGANDTQNCATNADCPGGFCSVGVQSCPICTGLPGNLTCHGGPNNGAACTPGTSPLGDPYPTSQDCPPDEGTNIGALPIGFSLSTKVSTMTAKAIGDQPNVFCGFCFDSDDGVGVYANPPVACSANSDCNGVTGIPLPPNPQTTITFEKCKQGNGSASGCFNAPTCTSIVENGSPAGDLTDGAAHNVTLQSIFCIPPAYNGTVDGAADLPGPGATAIPGTVQLK